MTTAALLFAGVALSITAARAASSAVSTTSQPAAAAERTFQVTAKKYTFTPARLEVTEGDLVRIELHTEDIAHSLTIDGYRLAKRVDAGHPSVLEFRADQVGTFPFSCNLQIDDGCRKMRGELVVRRKR